MKIKPVVFIAFKGADNHGIGYMRAVLKDGGFKSLVLDLRKGKKNILRSLQESDPLLVGFSVVFQTHFHQFRDLISYLRDEGINCHFTAGGHYASMKYEELFSLIPSLDSIVRFEGEYTILELAGCIYTGSDWKGMDGLAYLKGKQVIVNSLRPAESDLDKFPVQIRPRLRKIAYNMKFATLIAGRGCVHNCSFCNTREYYRQMSGPAKRNRSPEKVVSEMADLYKRKKCSIFLFDDDDFPVTSRNGNAWISRFCIELKVQGLNNKIIWKINCRPDEIDEKNFRLMKENGLFHVFIGIEDGTEEGLKKLNKKTTVEQNLKNIKILKDLGIGFDFGFMLFQPDTDFNTLQKNLAFLEILCGDGCTPLTFLKLLPLYETKVEKELMKSGRLKILNGTKDYDFTENSMNDYYNFIMGSLSECLSGKNGFVTIAQNAICTLEVASHFIDKQNKLKNYKKHIHEIISQFNIFLLFTLKKLIPVFKSGKYKSTSEILEFHKIMIKTNHDYYRNLVLYKTGDFIVRSSPTGKPVRNNRTIRSRSSFSHDNLIAVT